MAGRQAADLRPAFPMPRFFRKKTRAVGGLFLFFLLLVVTGCSFLVRVPVLTVTGERGPVFCLPLVKNETFSLTFVHSVQKTPVWENFTLGEEDRLVLVSTFYESLGVGLPFLPGEGELTNDHGRFVLTGLNRTFPEIALRVSPVAKQTLVYRGRQIDLNGLFPPDSLVRLRAGHWPAAKLFLAKAKNVAGGWSF